MLLPISALSGGFIALRELMANRSSFLHIYCILYQLMPEKHSEDSLGALLYIGAFSYSIPCWKCSHTVPPYNISFVPCLNHSCVSPITPLISLLMRLDTRFNFFIDETFAWPFDIPFILYNTFVSRSYTGSWHQSLPLAHCSEHIKWKLSGAEMQAIRSSCWRLPRWLRYWGTEDAPVLLRRRRRPASWC